MTAVVTGQEVITRFAGRSRAAAKALAHWRADPSKAEVVPVVEAHTSRVVHTLSAADVEDICNQTEHALGSVRRRDAERVALIRDWHPGFAFTHLLHIVTEDLGRPPTWQQLKQLRGTLDERLWAPARAAIAEAVTAAEAGCRSADPAERDRTRDLAERSARHAMQWRVGNAYYSFLRELYVLAVLRDAGLDARTHPLADALFRADLWCGDTIVSLYIGNRVFRSGSSGRKPRPESLLRGARPPFRFLSLELPTTHVFGVVHLPARDAILRKCALLASDRASGT